MIDVLEQLKKVATVGVVGGSNYPKVKEQLTETVFNSLDWGFTENGLMGFKNGEKFHEKSISDHLGDDFINKFVSFCLVYIGQLELPIKRGTFVEFRAGMINVSPIGRNCSQKERDDYEAYDKIHNIRGKMVDEVRKLFGDQLQFSVGGQISFDCVPHGWNKTYCLQFVEEEFDEIYFFGDRTDAGGNDHEIYMDQRLEARFSVKTYKDTVALLQKHFLNSE